MTISKDFFKERMDFLRWLDKQQKGIEEIFDCDIYGGPMKVWEAEYSMWRRFFNNERSYDLFITFAAFYANVEECHSSYEFTFSWNGNEFFEFHDETVEIEDGATATDDNWIDAVWKRICELENEVNG